MKKVPYDVTPSQLAWHVLANGELNQNDEGACRVCGGRLVGVSELHNPSGSWMDEFRCLRRDSDYVCEACNWAFKNRNLLSMTIKKARVISLDLGLLDYDDSMIPKLIEDMQSGFEPPFLFFVRESANAYKKHVILESAVSWSKEYGYVTLLTGPDNFTIPINFKKLAQGVLYLQTLRQQGKYINFRSDPFWRVASYLQFRLSNKEEKVK